MQLVGHQTMKAMTPWLLPVFVNKALLKHSHTYLFTCDYESFLLLELI